MKNADVVEALDSLRVITNETHMIVVGSQSLHGRYPDVPDSIMYSREVDVMLMNKAKLANWISEVVGDDTPFQVERGYYIDHVIRKNGFPILATGWEQRAIRKTDIPGCIVDYLSPEDLAIAKLGAGREKDFDFIAGMVRHGLVSLSNIQALVSQVPIEFEQRKKVEMSMPILRAQIEKDTYG